MSSFLTDLPFKNSFKEIEYNHTEKCLESKRRKRNENKSSILNNPYITLHTNPKRIDLQTNYRKDSFLSKTSRFLKLSEDKILNPGPGTYQISSALSSMSNSSLSSKGYGIGFVSKEQRFKNRKHETEKYSPGPGDYKYERYRDIQYSINTSLQGQSLFASKVTKSKKSIENFPTPWSYNPIKTQEIEDPLHGPSFHKLKSKRFTKMNNHIPGPGTYTEEYDLHKLDSKNSFFFNKPKQAKENFLKKYQIKTEISKNDTAFRLKQNTKDGQLLKAKFNSIMGINAKSNDQLLQIGNNNNAADNNQEFEYEYYNREKKNLFELSPPRWKKAKHQFLVPGPAFYCPKISQNKLSFNQTNKAFLYSPGVLFSSTAPYPSKD